MDRDRELLAAYADIAGGRFQQAHARSMALLKASSSDDEAFAVLGAIAMANRVFDKAADLFRRAAALSQRPGRHLTRLAQAELARNNREAALSAAQRALPLDDGEAQERDDLGVVLSRLNLHTQALACFERAAARAPAHGGFLTNLGWARQFVGDFAGAADAYRRAIAADPKAERAYVALVRLLDGSDISQFEAPLEQLFKEAAGDPIRSLNVGHALAKIREDLNDPAGSLAWLDQAKRGRRRDPEKVAANARNLFAAAEAWLPADAAPVTRIPDGPIFVFGLPRTGTTLVDRILSSHPNVVSVGEPLTLPLALREVLGARGGPLLDPEALGRLSPDRLGLLAAVYSRMTAPADLAGRRFLDKSPLHFLFAGMIARAMPNARMICLRRDPVDACLSIYRNLFDPTFEAYDFTYDLEATATYVTLFERFADACWARLSPTQFCEVRYEDLIADQRAQSERLVAFCGLPWDERCMRFEDNAAPVSTASAAQVRRPIYSSSVGRWKRYGEGLEPALAVFRRAGLVEAADPA